jgi:hypothetical protein
MHFHGTFELYRYQKLEHDDIYKVDISNGLARSISIPPIKSLNAATSSCIQNPHEVGEDGLPHAEFEFVEKIWDKHCKEIESKFE